MTHRSTSLLTGAAALAALAFAAATPAAALSSAECSALYKAEQQAKRLNGMTWNTFQKEKCSADTTAAAKPAEAKVAQAAPAAAPAPKAEAKAPAAKAEAAAHGLTSKECSLKYKEAKAANTLNGMKWNDFRKSQCGAGAAPPAGKVDAATKAATVAAGNAVFPSAVSAKYASEKPGRARMHTCLDQYRINKTSGGNGGLVWISRKGGGYYSECNKRLKAPH